MERRSFVRSAAMLVSGSVVLPARRPRPDSADRTPSRAHEEDLDTVVPRAMALAGVPGVAVGVLRSGAVSERFWGKADAVNDTPLSAESRFEAASLSKPVTAYLALRLVDRGQLDLDRPLAQYGAPMPNAGDERAMRITTRHVLSHSSGWRNWRRASDPPLTAEFEPGSRYQYSGEAFVQLQRVIEHVTGRGFADLASDLIFRPLGMTRSTFLLTSADVGPSLVVGHGTRQQPRESHGLRVGRFLEQKAPPERAATSMRVAEIEALLPSMQPPAPAIPAFVMPNAAGSLVTTVADYLRFWSHLLASSETLLRMAKLETPINAELSWGLGMGRELVTGETWLWHQGDNPGFKNFVSVDPGRRNVVVAFTNADTGMRVAERAVRAVTGHDHGAFTWA